MTTQSNLENKFNSSQKDIKDAWENPARGDMDKINHDWIYSVDPETMDFVKAMWKLMDGNKSLYDAFVVIMKAKTIRSILVFG